MRARHRPPSNKPWDGTILIPRAFSLSIQDLLREALAVDPESDPVRWQLGAVLYRMGRHGEALAYVEALREAEWIGPRAYLFLGTLYNELGREDEARRALATYQRQKRRGEIEERVQLEIGTIADHLYQGR